MSDVADLPTFANKLFSDNDNDVFKGAVGVRTTLSVDAIVDASRVDEVIGIPGLVRRLVDLLRRDDAPKLQFECAWALTNIAGGTQAHTSIVVDHGAVPEFVRLLSRPSVAVQEQAAWALSNIAGDCVDVVLAAGALPPLLAALTPAAPLSLLRIGTTTLRNMCRKTPPVEVVSMLLPKVLQLLDHDDQEVMTDALWAIAFLSGLPGDQHNAGVQMMVDCGCLPRVVGCLSRHATTVTPALRTIGNVVSSTAAHTQAALDAGALQPLVQLLQHAKASHRCEAAWIFSNLMADGAQYVQRCLDSGALPLLVRLACGAHDKVAREACWAICNACTNGTPDQVDTIAREKDAVAMLLRIAGGSDERAVVVALEGLSRILDVGAEIAAAAGGEHPYYELFDSLKAQHVLAAVQGMKGMPEAHRILDKHFTPRSGDCVVLHDRPGCA